MIYITHDEVTELFKTAEVEVKELTAEMLVNDDYTAMKMHRISLKNGIKISSRICETQNNDCVGIIGGADGPTVIMTGEKSQGKLYAACSALHFEPVRDDVEWCTMFSIKNFDETTINLI